MKFDPSFQESTSKTSLNSLETQAHVHLPNHMPRRMMCGPSGATHSRRSSSIETQAFVENEVDFKSGAMFATVWPCRWNVMTNSRSNLGTSNKFCLTGGIQVQPLPPSRLSVVLY